MRETLLGGIPGARPAFVPQAAHLANVEQPEAFTAAVLAHLTGHGRGSADVVTGFRRARHRPLARGGETALSPERKGEGHTLREGGGPWGNQGPPALVERPEAFTAAVLGHLTGWDEGS